MLTRPPWTTCFDIKCGAGADGYFCKRGFVFLIPYKFWHHEHRFRELSGGTENLDKIHYQLPYGIVGKAIHQIKIKGDLQKIFAYRQSKIVEIFGHSS